MICVYNHSTVNMSGGSVGNAGVSFSDDSSFTMSCGNIFGSVWVSEDASANISGGWIQDSLLLRDDVTVTMSGGSFNGRLEARHDTTITMAGGAFGGILEVLQNSTIYLDGTDFEINGIPLENGDKLSDFGRLVGSPGDLVLDYYTGTITGTLANGTVLNNEFKISNIGWFEGVGDIIIIPEPCSLALLGLGAIVMCRRKLSPEQSISLISVPNIAMCQQQGISSGCETRIRTA